MNAAKEGTRAAYGPKFGPVGLIETLNAVKDSEHYKTPLGPNQGRGVASGFWFNIGGETSASMLLNEDGTVELTVGTPDVGGSRASMAMMVAEELGVHMNKIRPRIGDTSTIGYTFLTGGSRATFSSGMAVVQASRSMIEMLRERAAKIWDIPGDAVIWEDGQAKPAGSNAGDFEPLTSPSRRGKPAAPSQDMRKSTLRAQAPALARIWWMSKSIPKPGM
jgi:CO/xanthine dehydrogenase Mo-binding subunit